MRDWEICRCITVVDLQNPQWQKDVVSEIGMVVAAIAQPASHATTNYQAHCTNGHLEVYVHDVEKKET